MIEAKITCNVPCDIPDLGIVGLRRGEVRWVTVLQAESSADLIKEQRKGNVKVNRQMRRNHAAPRRPAPPFVAASRPPVRERAEPEVVEKHVQVERVVEHTVDTDELAAKMKAELLGDLLPNLKDVIAQEVGRALASHETPTPAPQRQEDGVTAGQLESVLESVMRRVMPAGGGASAVQGGSRNSGPEGPLFVPTKIVDKDAKGKITVKSAKSAEADDLDDAQAALREMKRARRGRKKSSEEK
jgi:hypothetical protein